ncbi:FtsW/RodA/SpoVE family cell cycle protein [Nonomuraea sp. N2-4H]|uniref:FtsW/RodA/SpoVE family cell cycle protein n=1 Tax=Nonomuraea sp. N2-4H TaxID=3128898 RepID=UPI0032534615
MTATQDPQVLRRLRADGALPGSRRRGLLRLLKAVDWPLLLPALALSLAGVLLVWSATRPRMAAAGDDPQTYLVRQSVNVLVGLAVMAVVALPGRGALRAWALPAYLVSVLGLAAVLTPLGRTANGAQSWLSIGGLELQPSEPAKVTLVLMLAVLLAERSRRRVPLALAAAGLPLGLIMLQPDLGTAMIMVVTTGGMLVVAGVRWRWLALLAGAGPARRSRPGSSGCSARTRCSGCSRSPTRWPTRRAPATTRRRRW